MSKFNQIKYVNEYNALHYDRINLLTPRGLKSEIKAHTAARGESVNAFIVRAVAAQIERDRAEDERRAAEAVTAPATLDNAEAVTPSEAPAPTPTPETVTPSEPETAASEQSRPTSDGQQTAAEAPEDSTPRTGNAPTEINTTGSTAELEQDGRTPTAPAPKSIRRGRPPKQADRDPAQLTLDDDSATDNDSGRE